MDIAFKSATELSADIRQKKISSLELLDHYIARVERFNPPLNAIIFKDYERARVRAGEADAALARGDNWGPLHGLPMTLKESYGMAGTPTTQGIPEMKDNVPSQDSLPVQRLKVAGAVIFGKTNVPIRLADLQSYNEIYGTTNNPWDVSRGPGGSSGGSAASVAAGMTGLDAGSDIGGSIRNPAHFCGVFGHKASWGIIPPRGHALPGTLVPSDISVLGPLARSAEDLRLALDILAGPDEMMGTGWSLTLPEASQKSLKDFRVAVWFDADECPLDQRVRERLDAAAQVFRDAGAQVSDDARPDFDVADSHMIYQYLLNAVMGSRLPAEVFDGALESAFEYKVSDKSDEAVSARARLYFIRDWNKQNEARQRLRWAWHEFFKSYDIILMPVSSTTAFEHDHSDGPRLVPVNNEKRSYFESVFWAGITGVAFLPGTVVPVGPASDGLPVGLQIAGPEGGDRVTIEAARLLANEMGGFTPPPGYDA